MKYDTRIVTAWFKEHGLLAIPEYRFAPPRKWRFDWIFSNSNAERALDIKVALEVQGGLFIGGRHSRGAALLKEHEKLNAAACLGWRILYCVPDDLCTMDVLRMIREAM